MSSNLRKLQLQRLVSIYEKQNVITQSVHDTRNAKNVFFNIFAFRSLSTNFNYKREHVDEVHCVSRLRSLNLQLMDSTFETQRCRSISECKRIPNSTKPFNGKEYKIETDMLKK